VGLGFWNQWVTGIIFRETLSHSFWWRYDPAASQCINILYCYRLTVRIIHSNIGYDDDNNNNNNNNNNSSNKPV
jgi:hypothetical protein